MSLRYYLIVNCGTLMRSEFAQTYPYQLIEAEQYMSSHNYREDVKSIQQVHRPGMILDNGAHHFNNADLDNYLAIVGDLKPHVTILPDMVGAASMVSRNRGLEFSRKCELVHPHGRMMYAPQGMSRDEIEDEYWWALEYLDPAKYIIGFGQSYLAYEGPPAKPGNINPIGNAYDDDARTILMQRVLGRFHPAEIKHQLHILGGRWPDPPDAFLSLIHRYPFTGIDTIKPCHCAIFDKRYPVMPVDSKTGKPAPVLRTSIRLANEDLLKTNVVLLARRYGIEAREQD